MSEHALIISTKLSAQFGSEAEISIIGETMALMRESLAEIGGELDGEEFGESECRIYIYGKNAEDLFKACKPLLEKNALFSGAVCTKRYGDELDAVEEYVVISVLH